MRLNVLPELGLYYKLKDCLSQARKKNLNVALTFRGHDITKGFIDLLIVGQWILG